MLHASYEFSCWCFSPHLISSFLELYWRNRHNIPILFIIIVEFRFNTNDDPNDASNCHNDQFEPRQPHYIIIILYWIALARIVNFWLHGRSNEHNNGPAVEADQIVDHGNVVEAWGVLHLVAQILRLERRAVKQSPIVVEVPHILVAVAENFQTVVEVLGDTAFLLKINDATYLRKEQYGILESIECLQAVVVDEPLAQVLIHSPHIWKKSQAIHYPFYYWVTLKLCTIKFQNIPVPIVVHKVNGYLAQVHEGDGAVCQNLCK